MEILDTIERWLNITVALVIIGALGGTTFSLERTLMIALYALLLTVTITWVRYEIGRNNPIAH